MGQDSFLVTNSRFLAVGQDSFIKPFYLFCVRLNISRVFWFFFFKKK